MNGMNGAVMANGAGMPTSAGHHSELNYIYTMVEELSRQLAENRRVTDDIVGNLGRIRQRAHMLALGNEELLEASADNIQGTFPACHAGVVSLTVA